MFSGLFKKNIITNVEILFFIAFIYILILYFSPNFLLLSSDGLVNLIFIYVYKLILLVLPFLLVFWLGMVARALWLHYVQVGFISGIDWVLLEVIPPRDVLRSPKAMELFLSNALYHWSEKGGLETYWQGAVWFWFSLEIVSLEGQVHFYIRTPTRVRSLIETQMYAQFPQSQIKEVEDYTLAVDKISPDSKWNLWGCEFRLRKPDAFPIKTYVDFGLDKDPKEELKVDPITPIIELFGSLGKDEQMWLQFVITPSKKKFPEHAHFWEKTHDWVKESEEQIKKVLSEYTRQHARLDGTFAKEIRSPDHLKPIIDGASKKMLKVGFDTGIRTCYVAKKEAFNMSNRRNLRLIFRQYASPFVNELWRINSTQADAFSSNLIASFIPLSSVKVMKLADRMLEEYREREFFHPPMRHKIRFPWPISPVIFPNYFHPHVNVLNTEELATLWHFPGQILKVPTLERIESKEASPPTNLPI